MQYMAGKIGLSESMAMAVGGMVGGGIFAVLGVVAAEAETLAWLSFVISGGIAMAAGYSFIRLNGLLDTPGSPVTVIEVFTGRTTLAGMMGWTFVIGYVGTMGLYTYAFASYLAAMVGARAVGGVPLQPVLSVAVIVLFVGVNAAGAHASGRTEDTLVGLKVLILLGFCGGGLYYGVTHGQLKTGLSMLGFGPLIAAAISFVAFEGWELLMFDQESIRNPRRTVKKAIFISIAGVTVLYVLVAVVTTSLLSPVTIQANAETALAIAAQPFLGRVGFVLISVAALFSTASALNATLFSTSRLMHQLVTEAMLPRQLDSHGDEPVQALVLLGILTAILTFFGSLDVISSFASLAFILIFGLVSFLAYTERSPPSRSAIIPAIGTIGAGATIIALGWYLATTKPATFLLVVILSLAVIFVEVVYFDRRPIEAEIQRRESQR